MRIATKGGAGTGFGVTLWRGTGCCGGGAAAVRAAGNAACTTGAAPGWRTSATPCVMAGVGTAGEGIAAEAIAGEAIAAAAIGAEGIEGEVIAGEVIAGDGTACTGAARLSAWSTGWPASGAAIARTAAACGGVVLAMGGTAAG